MPTKPSSKTPPASPAKPAAANGSLASERFANATHEKPAAGKEAPSLSRNSEAFLVPPPKPRSTAAVPLTSFIGQKGVKELTDEGAVVFHLMGDTGEHEADGPQQMVADAMTLDYTKAHPERSPALALHLGDVVYDRYSKAKGYRYEFYRPYRRYPGKIISIPGNHDGDLQEDPTEDPLDVWLQHFADTQPRLHPAAGEIYRETMTLPGCYWLLDTPYAQIIGLYSNRLENPGHIRRPLTGEHQWETLVQWLGQADKSKGLVLATHHPFYSSGGHAGSAAMLADVDDACRKAGRWPDLVLSAHSHTYQRYVRRSTGGGPEIAYAVVGCSGHGNQPVKDYDHNPGDGVDYMGHYQGYGYARLTTRPGRMTLEFIAVKDGNKSTQDRFTVDWQNHRVLEK